LHPTNENLLLPKSSRWKAKQPNKNKNPRRRRRRRMPRFQFPKAETIKTKHLQPLILPHNKTPIETHTHIHTHTHKRYSNKRFQREGFKLRRSWIHAKSDCGVRFGLACSLLLKIYFLSERPIDCPLYFPRLLFFFFFFYDASLLACD
jgi:hypothetical protein